MSTYNIDMLYSPARRGSLTVGQGRSGYAVQLVDAIEVIKMSMKGLYRLANGGTAVGSELNSPKYLQSD
jgi:fumarate hydratase class II